MEQKIARVTWKRGQYSDVFRSTITDPSPLKKGQKVNVIWGRTHKEYSAVIECYPLEDEASEEPDLPPRRAHAKRKLIPESPPEACKKPNKKARKQKERPKGKILDTASPSSVVISSSDSSDGEEDGYPLSSITVVEAESDSFLQEDIGITSDLVSKAIRTIDNTTSWTNQNDYGTQMMATEELQFIRTVLGRLECSFARQEAKMDRILTLLTSSTSLLQTPLRPSFTPVNSHFTTPLPTDSSAEFPPPPVTPRPQDVEVRCPDQSSSMCSPMEDGTGTVAVGGNANVRLTKSDYNFAKAASKPTVMSLRLVDHLFTKDTLTKSTVQGTKEFSPLDRDKLDAIKTEVLTAFSYQCRGMEDVLRMWEQCKTSIGKRCQNLRKNRAM